MEWLSQNWGYLVLGLSIGLVILLTLYLIAKGKLNALKPYVETLIVEIETKFKDEQLEKAGVEKMNYVVSSLRKSLPVWCQKLLSESLIEAFCQSVYDLISDNLTELCEKYRNKYLK